ncbi:MAG: glutathione S-transferase family protein [Solirubrobacterales bacterium]|nr:glutathione S-transferase family protein [Solirubrobacterales bacterium]
MTATLWQIPVSHFSEKARWALDLKGIEHERRSPPPPSHIPIALWLTRGAGHTFPVLVLDGRAIGDSSAIIAALEELAPEPPLYPSDREERRRALEIESWFDAELGPYARSLVFHELRDSPGGFADFASPMLPGPVRKSRAARSAGGLMAKTYTQVRWRVAGAEAGERARSQVLLALDRLERELEHGDGTYLVGGRFSVADLTAASLFAPVVQPPEGPEVAVEVPPSLEAFRASIAERPGYRWVEETFRRDRGDARRP